MRGNFGDENRGNLGGSDFASARGVFRPFYSVQKVRFFCDFFEGEGIFFAAKRPRYDRAKAPLPFL